MKKNWLIFFCILFTTLIVYLPIIVQPQIILNRGNDLAEFFWPIIYFVKQQLLINHALPLWNNLFLSGTPLLPDPQSPLFYLPNLLFLFLPIDTAFIVSFFLHTLTAGVLMYFCCRKALNFSVTSSILASLFYITTPKLASYLEAGHVGLIYSFTWIPLIIYSVLEIFREPKIFKSILFAVGLSGLFFSHTLIFLLFSITSAILYVLLTINNKHLINKSLVYYVLGAVLTFGIIAVTFLPQLEWQRYTTRSLLINDKDTYPKWSSVTEPLKYVLIPGLPIMNNLDSIDSEKWLAVGLLPTLLALAGLLMLNNKYKLEIILFGTVTFSVILNNASPIYFILHNQKWFNLFRVSSRLWMLVIPLISILTAYVYEKLSKGKPKINFVLLFATLALIEPIIYSWNYYQKPIYPIDKAPKEVYELLSKDKDFFRVFCTTRCLSQKESALYGLELMDGYNTLAQTNFNKQAWQLTNTYWDYYSLSIPPIGTYTFEKLQPRAKYLGEYNVKYVISTHPLLDHNFSLKEKFGNYLVYINNLYQPRAPLPITIYTPNHIRINLDNYQSTQLILREVYSPGWKAFLDGKDQVTIQETPNGLRAVDIKPNSSDVDFIYQPSYFKIGGVVSSITIFSLIGYGIVLLFINISRKTASS